MMKLNNDNQKIKNLIEFSKMSELIAENKELLDEIKMLRTKLAESKEFENHNHNEYIL